MIPVHTPVFGEEEIENVVSALRAGEVSGTSGQFIQRFEKAFAEYCQCRHGVAVSSGSTALHLAAAVLDIGPGDEVLVSACTNIATANAVVQQNAVVVPVDSERDTWNMDVSLLENLVTSHTKAILPVHIYGHPVDMDEVLRIARKYDLKVIEDCAEAHGAEYKSQKVGSLGDIGCFSFYANKIITCGEGGMLVTNDEELAKRARSLRNLAFGTPRFVHEDLGYNYRMTNLQAGIGLAQLTRIEEIIRWKRHIAELYTEQLGEIEGLQLPVERSYARNVYWMYCIVVERKFGMSKEELMRELVSFQIETRSMFCPMNLQPSLLKRGAVKLVECPEAERVWQNGLYLPSGQSLTSKEIDQVCFAIGELACV